MLVNQRGTARLRQANEEQTAKTTDKQDLLQVAAALGMPVASTVRWVGLWKLPEHGATQCRPA